VITIPSWLAFAIPAAFTAGMFLGVWVKRDDYQDGYSDGEAAAWQDDDEPLSPPPPGHPVWRNPQASMSSLGEGGELLPELPDWTGEQLRFIGDDDPGETTGPFDITSLDGLDERVAVPVRRDLALAFTDLPMPADASVLEQEWSWGKVAWQILEFRRWYADDSNWELAAA
jgi:hypothetical protein